MSSRSLLRLLCPFILLPLCLNAAPGELDIVRKARAYVGPSDKLDSITSLHYTGTLTAQDGKKFALEIIYQKPLQHRISAIGADLIDITVLDGYDGWQRIEDAKDSGKWKINLLASEQIKRLRANTFDSLNLFKANVPFGTIEDQGTTTIDGRSARKIAFRHDKAIVFVRYFDSVTGKLIRTEREQGTVIVEEGEMLVDGIRFPRKISNTSLGADGKPSTMVLEFDKITLNETFAASLFAVPSLGRTPGKP